MNLAFATAADPKLCAVVAAYRAEQAPGGILEVELVVRHNPNVE